MFVFNHDEFNSMMDIIYEQMLDDNDCMVWIGKYGTFMVSDDKDKCQVLVQGPDLNKSFGFLGAIRKVFH